MGQHQTGKQISDFTFTINLVISVTCGDIYLCYTFFFPYLINISFANKPTVRVEVVI